MGRHTDKVKESALAAIADLTDGARVMVGGFGLCGNPEALIAAVVEKKPRNLTLISNNAGNLGKSLATWLQAGLVRKVILSYIGNNEDLHRLMGAGAIEVEVVPQGTLVFDGRDYLLERALHADFALIRARTGDRFGNLRFWRTTRNFQPAMASAARTTVAEVDRLVDVGGLDPDDVHLPGIFVHRLVEVATHEDPFEYKTTRPRPGRRVAGEGG
jgi:3-oxoacid CoA-transferase subunit A